jgi:hypothetical protein
VTEAFPGGDRRSRRPASHRAALKLTCRDLKGGQTPMSDRMVLDSWVKRVLDVDPASSPSAAPPAGSGAPPSEDPTGLFGRSKTTPTGGTPTTPPSTSGTVTPPPKPKPVKLTLTSETEVTQPANRARTKIGVGERVTLKLTPVSGAWKATGSGTLSAATGATVVLTASGKPGKVTVSVTAADKTEKLTFTVIAPNSVHQDTINTEHYTAAQLGLTSGLPNAGFHGQVYCGPDSVNFSNITFLEAEIGCKASGSWKAKNGKGHGPNATPIGFEDTVVSGKGTKSFAVDHCWSGYVPGLTLKDWTGKMTFSIPWTYQCNGTNGKIATVVQTTSTSKNGTTSTKKAGGSSGDHALD